MAPRTIFLLVLIAPIVSLSIASTPKLPRLSLKLIHGQSIRSPHYKPDVSALELYREALDQSRARLDAFGNNDLRLGLVPARRGVVFLANVSVGQPPVPQLLHVDTGSSLSWVQCHMCYLCPRPPVPRFDPSRSSTYSETLCPPQSKICSDAPMSCFNGKCTFELNYVDHTVVTGLIVSEQLLFDGTKPVQLHFLGCAHTRTWPVHVQASGLLGLGYEKFSLTQQLGGKFSHCFGDIRDPEYEHNMLVFDEGAIFEGGVTPMSMYRGHYYVILEGIHLGHEKLDIDPSVFKRQIQGEGGGAILDKGTTMTMIARGGYDPLLEKVRSLLDRFLNRTTSSDAPERICYYGHVDRDLMGFPSVSLDLAEGASIVLDRHSLFWQIGSDQFCLAIEPADGSTQSTSIIGTLAMQYYNVGYDINAGKLYVQRTECERLER